MPFMPTELTEEHVIMISISIYNENKLLPLCIPYTHTYILVYMSTYVHRNVLNTT